MLPKNFKTELQNHIEQLWSVWRSLGVYSEGKITAMPPEEAIIGLCIFGRYDQRLFDEALSFVIQNNRFLSKNRLLSLVEKIDPDAKKVFQVMGIFLEDFANDKRFILPGNKTADFTAKPFFISLQNGGQFSGKTEDPIFLKAGFKRNTFSKSEKLRNLNFVSENNQWIRAKLVFGNTVRADTIMELVRNNKVTGPGIAFNTGYTQKSIWNILSDFELAGLVTGEKSFNRIIYTLSEKGRKQFKDFTIDKKIPDVSNWIKAGYYLSAFYNLPENASDLLIKSEEKRLAKIVSKLAITKDII
jgi:hypothetical protein